MTLYYDPDDMEEAAVAQRTEKTQSLSWMHRPVYAEVPRITVNETRLVDEPWDDRSLREDRTERLRMNHLRMWHTFGNGIWGEGYWNYRDCRLWGEGNCKWQ